MAWAEGKRQQGGRSYGVGSRERGVSCNVREQGFANEAAVCAVEAEIMQRRFPASPSCIFDFSRHPFTSWKRVIPAVLSRKVTVLKALLGRETVAKVTTQQKGHTKVMDKGRSSGRQLREEEGFKKDYFDRKR